MQTQKIGNLLDVIARRIDECGDISIAEYMELALTHPEFGYYTRKDPLGAEGDFITAPEISQIFGEIIGAWLAEQWRIMGRPKAVLAELGPGRGTLLGDILRATAAINGFHEATSVHLIETSPTLQSKQQRALGGKHLRLSWHASLADIPKRPLLLVANEFFDALPVRQFVRSQGDWCERRIRCDKNGRLQVTLRPELPPTAATYNVDDTLCEYSPAVENITRAISEHINAYGGAALIIDYGYEGGSHHDTLQAVRAHRYHDPLIDPGTADLTCHVDFELIRQTAAGAGAIAHGPVTQGAFLTALGAVVRAARLCANAGDAQKAAVVSGLERLLSPEQMGEMFKTLAITAANHPKPEGF